MGIGGDHGAAALGCFDQVEAILERSLVGHGLGIERSMEFRDKIGGNERRAQLITCARLVAVWKWVKGWR